MSRSGKTNSKKPQEQEHENIKSDSEHTGNYLRRLREEKGLSIQDVCEATRISETNLNAIENQNFSALPADTFTRGFLNIYAKFLEADQPDIASRFMQERDDSQLQGKRIKGKQSRKVLAPKTMAEPAHISSMSMAGILLLIIVVLFAGFCIYTSWNPFSFLIKETNNLQSVVTNVFPDSKPVPTEATQIDSDASVSTAAPDEPSPVFPSEEAAEKATPDEKTAEQSKGLEPAALTAAQPESNYILTVRFLSDTMITVTRDTDQPFSHAFSQGDEQSWSAATSITLSFDQPDSAAIFVNNTPVDFPLITNGFYTLRIPEDLPESAAND